MLYTAMPICWFATFDWQHTKVELMSHPELYEIGLKDKCFNAFVFWESYFMAIIQGGLLLFLTFYTLDDSAGQALQFDISSNVDKETVLSGGMIINGVFIFQAIIVIVNIKIMIATNTYSFLSFFWQFGSILLFYISFFVLQLQSFQQDIQGMYSLLYSMVSQWFLLFFFTLAYVLVEYIMSLGYANLQNIYQYQQMLEIKREKFLLQQKRAQRRSKLTMYKHRGFDFSGQEGHDLLVTEKLMSRLKEGIREKVFGSLASVQDFR